MYTHHIYPEGSFFTSIEAIKDLRITVMGLGLNGGGEAVVRFFLKHGAFVTVTDMKDEKALNSTIASIENDSTLDKSRLTYKLGGHYIEDFANADCVIKNPGVKIEGNKYLAAAKNIETDLSIFLKFSKSPIIAVTGSKGKSSTVSAIYYGLKNCGVNCYLGGNITVSPLTFLEKTDVSTPVILELSSWQLADLRGRKLLKPIISLITKIVPDHQNWYSSMDEYIADKRLIYADQDSSCYSIFDGEKNEEGYNPVSGESWGDLFALESKAITLRYYNSQPQNINYGVWQSFDEENNFEGKVLLPGQEKCETILKKLSVPGKHMRINVLNAALVLYLMGIKAEKICNVLETWQGVEHRLQFFYKSSIKDFSVSFYNDSSSTVPEAAAAATQAFEKPIMLISGGTDKQLDFSPFIETLVNSDKTFIPVKSIYLLQGSGTDKYINILKENSIKYKGPYDSLFSLLSDLKKDIQKNIYENETVVFSPGATSFGMFKNEFDRGFQFMEYVRQIFKDI